MGYKKIGAIALAGVLLLGTAFCGCGRKGDELTLGTVQGTTYVNDYFGLKVVAEEGFTYADDATIETIGLEPAAYDEQESDRPEVICKDLKSGKLVTDFYLSDDDYADSLNLTISYGGNGLKESMVDSIIDAELPSLTRDYETQGMRGVKCERSTTEFGGKPVSCIKTNASIELKGGAYVEIYQTQIQIIKGDYIGCLTATTYAHDTTEEMLKMATPIH